MKKIFFLTILFSFLILTMCGKKDEKTELYQEIKSANKMVLAKMSITKTGYDFDENTFGRRVIGYSYDSYMRAFLDLSALQIDDLIFDDANKTVKVTLPPIVTELIGRDTEMKEVYNNITGLRNPYEEKEITKIKEDVNTNLKNEINENPMFKFHLQEAAKRKARKYFETLFEENGYVASIDFKTSDQN